MKKLWKSLLACSLALMMCLGLAACNNNQTTEDENNNSEQEQSNTENTADGEKQTLKIGCLPLTEVPVNCLKEVLAAEGYEVEIVMFDANNMPATALKDGDIDGLIANHLPWIKTFNEENSCELVMVEPYYYYSPFALYSTKHESLDALPDGAQVVIPNDPANMERSLIMLQDLELITLGEKKDTFYTTIDVVENTKNIQFVEAEMTMTARNAQDVDAVFAAATVAQEAGLDPTKYLYMDPGSSDYPVGLVVAAEDKDAEWATKGMELVKSDEMKQKFNDEFKGAYALFE